MFGIYIYLRAQPAQGGGSPAQHGLFGLQGSFGGAKRACWDPEKSNYNKVIGSWSFFTGSGKLACVSREKVVRG